MDSSHDETNVPERRESKSTESYGGASLGPGAHVGRCKQLFIERLSRLSPNDEPTGLGPVVVLRMTEIG